MSNLYRFLLFLKNSTQMIPPLDGRDTKGPRNWHVKSCKGLWFSCLSTLRLNSNYLRSDSIIDSIMIIFKSSCTFTFASWKCSKDIHTEEMITHGLIATVFVVFQKLPVTIIKFANRLNQKRYMKWFNALHQIRNLNALSHSP